MAPVSTLVNPLRDTDLTASRNSMELYLAQRNENGKITDFRLIMVNTPAQEMWGKSENELIGQSICQLMSGKDGQFLISQFSLVLDYERIVQFEMDARSQRAEAGATDIFCVSKLKDDVVMVINDVIDYKQAARLAEQKQLQQAELYKTILDTSLTSISVLEAIREQDGRGKIIDFRYTLVNHERLRMAGQPEAFFLGKKLTELFPGMIESGVFDHWVQVVETRKPHQFEVHYTYDGFDDWSLCLGSPFGDGVVISYTDITDQKQAAFHARQQAELLESIQNTSQMGISALRAQRDTNGTIVDFTFVMRNATAMKITGRLMDEVINKGMLDVYSSLKPTDVFSRYVNVVETRRPDQYEHYHNANGLEGWFDILISPWNDGVVINVIETTRLRKIEQEKIQQSTILQQVIDNTQAGLVLAKPIYDEQQQIIDFQYVLTNEYNARITGKSVAEMTGTLVGDLFPDWQHSDLFRQYVDVVESGQTQRLTFHYAAYGIKCWFDGSFNFLDGCLLYTYTDVTALKEAELEQQKYAELLEQVMNMTPASIVLSESIRNEAGTIVDFRIMKLNKMAADYLQNPVEKIQYRRVSKYLPGSLETPFFEQCKQVIETGEPIRVQVPWDDHWYDFSVARFGDGIVLAAQDVTPMHEYRQKLEVANLELKRSNENLQSFAFVSSHDLQEPLRKIISFANILKTQIGGHVDVDAIDVIERINTSAERMRLLIQDLLTYSKLETNQNLFRPVNIAQLIQELQEHELWMALNQSKGQIHLLELPTIVADPLQMHQLFQNLLSNAIKFCPRGSTPSITVSSRMVSRANVPAGLLYTTESAGSKSATNLFCEIAVTDNGIGFDEKYVDRIFQVFQRLHGRSQHAGSGIGLAICYKIVERHGGAITANSKPGEGSTFRVYLPVWKGLA
ncbi:PAS domain-containing protein [Spirosoma pollinicola]|uniref:histidine kinase n=1 Tax=Spirosoma pollinicola TaxID=2057025 RepID=A0A2K8Z0Q6_9BACT|nr:PAS domain-containing protein [Spirosoma pollinicola]AUD03398.1 hypothetical protein CWM47_17095 [Spirosoma pollinicola]